MSRLFALLTPLAILFAIGCGGDGNSDEAGDEIVVYTSVDEPYVRPIIEAFEAETGLRVRLVTDTEATKSVGLAERLRAERQRPVADVWWGNDPFHTIRLAEEGLFATYEPATAQAVLPVYRDEQNRWVGSGLRARVFAEYDWDANAADDGAVPGLAMPRTLAQFVEFAGDPVYAPVIARPTAGTTGGHVAALYVLWGEEKADTFFRALHAGGVRLVAGNSQAARAVSDASSIYALTDNDDVANVNASGGGAQIKTVLPDQNEGEIGTLTIPTTIALIAKPQPSDAAKRLVDFLASAEVEAMLKEADFTIGSVRQSPEAGGIRAMQIDYGAVADALPEAVRRATALLEGREPNE